MSGCGVYAELFAENRDALTAAKSTDTIADCAHKKTFADNRGGTEKLNTPEARD